MSDMDLAFVIHDSDKCSAKACCTRHRIARVRALHVAATFTARQTGSGWRVVSRPYERAAPRLAWHCGLRAHCAETPPSLAWPGRTGLACWVGIRPHEAALRPRACAESRVRRPPARHGARRPHRSVGTRQRPARRAWFRPAHGPRGAPVAAGEPPPRSRTPSGSALARRGAHGRHPLHHS